LENPLADLVGYTPILTRFAPSMATPGRDLGSFTTASGGIRAKIGEGQRATGDLGSVTTSIGGERTTIGESRRAAGDLVP
jgi:hypothetical protein